MTHSSLSQNVTYLMWDIFALILNSHLLQKVIVTQSRFWITAWMERQSDVKQTQTNEWVRRRCRETHEGHTNSAHLQIMSQSGPRDAAGVSQESHLFLFSYSINLGEGPQRMFQNTDTLPGMWSNLLFTRPIHTFHLSVEANRDILRTSEATGINNSLKKTIFYKHCIIHFRMFVSRNYGPYNTICSLKYWRLPDSFDLSWFLRHSQLSSFKMMVSNSTIYCTGIRLADLHQLRSLLRSDHPIFSLPIPPYPFAL